MRPVFAVPVFCALIVLGTVCEFPIPGSTLMQTGQTIAVLCAGALLGPAAGMLTVLLYIGLGVLGLPVFSEGASGVSVLQGNSGGYLAGFVLAAGLTGALIPGRTQTKAAPILGAMVAGHALILVCGWAWMSRQIGMQAAYENGIAPFYWGAGVKSAICTGVVLVGHRLTALARRRSSAGRDSGVIQVPPEA